MAPPPLPPPPPPPPPDEEMGMEVGMAAGAMSVGPHLHITGNSAGKENGGRGFHANEVQ